MKVLSTAVVWLLCLAAPLAAQPQTPPAPAAAISKFDRGVSLSMLAAVKSDLKEHYYDPAFHGIDIDAAFADAEQRIKAATTVNETVGIIAELLIRLDDSHTNFFPPDRKTRVIYGWSAAMIGDEPYVVSVKAGSDAAKKGLERGDRILAWNRFQPTRQNLWQIEYLYHVIRPQAMQRIIVRKPDGREQAIDVESKLEARDTEVRDLMADYWKQQWNARDEDAAVGDITVWKCRVFDDPKNMERMIKVARRSKALVLDLRGNGGGRVDALEELISRLFDRSVHLGVETTRKGSKPSDVKGRKDAFTGPLVVLVDSESGSASEFAARVVQLEKRGAVVGDRTAGAVMTSSYFGHTIGIEPVTDFGTMITIADVKMSDGASLEHVGVTPDEIVLPTAADLKARRDPALARAIEKLGGTITPGQAGRLFKDRDEAQR